jgi:integrase
MKSKSYLQQLDGRWYVRVKVPRTLQGRLRNTHVRRALGTSDLNEANRRKWPVIAKIQRELDRLRHGLDPAPPAEIHAVVLPARLTRPLLSETETLDSLVDRWLEGADYLAQTKQQHRQAYSELRAFLGGDRLPSELSTQMAVEYVEEHLRPSDWAYNTKRRKLDSLSALWDWLAMRQIVPRTANPWRGFKLGTKKTASTSLRRKRPYVDDELLRLFARRPAYPGLDDVMVIGLLTGMRLDEICSLRFADVQPDAGGFWLHVRKAKTRAGVRALFVSHELGVQILARRWRADSSADTQLFTEFSGGGYDGKLSWAVSKAFGRHRTKCGLTGETDFHSFRRSFITLLENFSVDQVRIARYVGHELPTLALAVYSGGSTARTMKETASHVRYGEAVESCLTQFVNGNAPKVPHKKNKSPTTQGTHSEPRT